MKISKEFNAITKNIEYYIGKLETLRDQQLYEFMHSAEIADNEKVAKTAFDGNGYIADYISEIKQALIKLNETIKKLEGI